MPRHFRSLGPDCRSADPTGRTIAVPVGSTLPVAARPGPGWLDGSVVRVMKETADFLRCVGRIERMADDYAMFVDTDFARSAAD